MVDLLVLACLTVLTHLDPLSTDLNPLPLRHRKTTTKDSGEAPSLETTASETSLPPREVALNHLNHLPAGRTLLSRTSPLLPLDLRTQEDDLTSTGHQLKALLRDELDLDLLCHPLLDNRIRMMANALPSPPGLAQLRRTDLRNPRNLLLLCRRSSRSVHTLLPRLDWARRGPGSYLSERLLYCPLEVSLPPDLRPRPRSRSSPLHLLLRRPLLLPLADQRRDSQSTLSTKNPTSVPHWSPRRPILLCPITPSPLLLVHPQSHLNLPL